MKDLKEVLKQKKIHLKELVDAHNTLASSSQESLSRMAEEILKTQGAIDQLQELLKDEEKK